MLTCLFFIPPFTDFMHSSAVYLDINPFNLMYFKLNYVGQFFWVSPAARKLGRIDILDMAKILFNMTGTR